MYALNLQTAAWRFVSFYLLIIYVTYYICWLLVHCLCWTFHRYKHGLVIGWDQTFLFILISFSRSSPFHVCCIKAYPGVNTPIICSGMKPMSWEFLRNTLKYILVLVARFLSSLHIVYGNRLHRGHLGSWLSPTLNISSTQYFSFLCRLLSFDHHSKLRSGYIFCEASFSQQVVRSRCVSSHNTCHTWVVAK